MGGDTLTELRHYGVKGQRWGRRKKEDEIANKPSQSGGVKRAIKTTGKGIGTTIGQTAKTINRSEFGSIIRDTGSGIGRSFKSGVNEKGLKSKIKATGKGLGKTVSGAAKRTWNSKLGTVAKSSVVGTGKAFCAGGRALKENGLKSGVKTTAVGIGRNTKKTVKDTWNSGVGDVAKSTATGIGHAFVDGINEKRK